MDMIEKVARAMAESAGFDWEHCAQSQWRSDARAGIEAMREPTPEMHRLGEVCCMEDCTDREGVNKVYRTMIDAALGIQLTPEKQ